MSRSFRFLWLGLAGLGLMVAARATTVRAPEFSDLVNKAEYIVRAVVKSVRTETDAAPQGGGRIHTLIELEVQEVITGNPPSPLVLRLLGGKVGDEEMRVDGVPQFAVGDERILFVRGNGRQFCPLVGVMHGSYPIKRDAATGRAMVTRGNGEPLYDQAEVSRPMGAEGATARTTRAKAQPLSPAEFSTAIRQSRALTGQQPELAK